MAQEQLAAAEEQERLGKEMATLHAKVGEKLGEMIDAGKKSKDVFREMDKNSDGHVSKMEFRQSMRSLGLMGKEYGAAEVDALFDELDKDHGGDLDLTARPAPRPRPRPHSTRLSARPPTAPFLTWCRRVLALLRRSCKRR
jgi:hypothetical protein